MEESEDVDSNDVIRVMVATDNHLGYCEKDDIRGEDSFTAFEEILDMAVTENVDFILLGGDLFHEAVPSQNALNRCLKLLRRYTLGDSPISIEFLSDQANNFHDALNASVNYEDPNINVSLPVFSIHGNHDDPSGFGRLSSLDLLANTGLINYFGRWNDLTKVEISPILLRKGETHLAIFGLSHIHDTRLARLFENDKVIIERPDPETGDWFNLMVLHQNRADRGPKNFIAEERLPDFLHLVIWGHEHDCHTSADYNPTRDFYVYQPGSSVATSLADGESIPKHVGILEIYKTKFQIKPMKLNTVRPFIFESVSLLDLVEELRLDEGNASEKVMQMAKERIEAMIERAKEQLNGNPKQPTLPLIRLRLVYTEEEQMFNAIRFGQQFNKRIANPADVVHFKKLIRKSKQEGKRFDKDVKHDAFAEMDTENATRVEDLVDQYFEQEQEKNTLKVLPSKIISEGIRRLVDQNDVDAAEQIFKFYREKAIDHLMEKLPNEDDITEELLSFKNSNKVSLDSVLKMLDSRGSKSTAKKEEEDDDILDDDIPDDDIEIAVEKPTPKGRAVAKPETTKRGRGRGRGRGKTSELPNTSKTSTRSGHMPQLNVSTTSKRTSEHRESIFDFVQSSRNLKSRGKNVPILEISDDSD